MEHEIVEVLYAHTPIYGPRPKVQVVCRDNRCEFLGNAEEHLWHVASLITERLVIR